MSKISLVIPVYNEADSLNELYKQVVAAVKPLDAEYEVIFVDDGSRDGSWERITDLHQDDSHVRGLRFRRNFGKSDALAAGFAAVRGDIVFTLDADLQDDPKEVPRFLSKLDEGYDLVSGWKKERKDPLEKRLPSKLFNAVTSWVSGVKLHDFNCGFKCYRSEVVKQIHVYGERHRFMPVLAAQEGFRIGEIPVEHHARKHGVSKFGWERYARGLLDLITLSFLGMYRKRPAHFFGGIGLLLLLAGVVIDVYIILLKIVTSTIQGRYPLLLAGLLLTIVGVQFVTFGLLSELLVSRERESHAVPHPVQEHVGFDA
jgi:glycosyltransferase involved in cell wall biosynthesis